MLQCEITGIAQGSEVCGLCCVFFCIKLQRKWNVVVYRITSLIICWTII